MCNLSKSSVSDIRNPSVLRSVTKLKFWLLLLQKLMGFFNSVWNSRNKYTLISSFSKSKQQEKPWGTWFLKLCVILKQARVHVHKTDFEVTQLNCSVLKSHFKVSYQAYVNSKQLHTYKVVVEKLISFLQAFELFDWRNWCLNSLYIVL